MEALFRLVSALTPTNVNDTLRKLSNEWREDLRADTESAPTDDWSEFRIISSATLVNATDQQLEHMDRDNVAAYRSGIATLRAYFDGGPST